MAKNEKSENPVEAVKSDTMTAYYAGLVESCPFDYITIPTIPREGAFALQKWTQRLQDDGHGVFSLSSRTRGGIVELYDDELRAALEYINTHRLYWESKGENKRVSIIPEKGEGAFRSRRDKAEGRIEPLSKYIWIRKTESVTLADQASSEQPKTLLEHSMEV